MMLLQARTMILRPFFCALLLLPVPAMAQGEAAELEGSWVLEASGTAIFRFDLEDAGQEWRGTWLRPASFGSDGKVFMQLRGPVARVQSMAGLEIGNEVELSFEDRRPGAVPDIFRFRLLEADRAELIYVGTDLAPYALRRVSPDRQPGPWEVERIYRYGEPAYVPLPQFARPRAAPAAEAEPDTQAPAAPAPVLAPRIGSDFLDGF